MSGPENAAENTAGNADEIVGEIVDEDDDPAAAEQRLFALHLVAFGARVRDIRGLRRMTQEHLAERTGMPRSQLSDIERGRKNITLESLHRLARRLDRKST